MTEAQLQSLFTAYIKKHKPEVTTNWELKILKKGERFNFKKIESNQLQGLADLQSEGVMWKHSDLDFRLKMCDCSFIKGQAYLGICWYEPRKPKVIHFLNIDTVLALIRSGQKSLTESEACDKEEYNIIL